MKAKHIESGLALLGALVVLVGVTFAAGSAFAAEPVADRVAAVTSAETLAVTIAGARAANAETAADAAAAIARDTVLGLDIQLADRTSKLTVSAE
jgi:Tfp pilus assembly protein PilX